MTASIDQIGNYTPNPGNPFHAPFIFNAILTTAPVESGSSADPKMMPSLDQTGKYAPNPGNPFVTSVLFPWANDA